MKTKIAAALMLGMLTCGSAMAGQYATALGKCLYKNSSAEDKTTLAQWAFVTMGKTDAAKSIATIPEATTNEVDQKTKSLILKLTTTVCGKEAAMVALREPTTGIQGAVAEITSQMIQERIKEQAASMLSGSSTTAGSVGGNILNLKEKGDAIKGIFKK